MKELFIANAEMLESPLAGLMLNHLDRFMGCTTDSQLTLFYDLLSDQPNIIDQWSKVVVCSQYIANMICSDPDSFFQQLSQAKLTHSRNYDFCRQLQILLKDCSSEQQLMMVIRRFRRWEIFRIIWRDINELATFEEIVKDISDLADACIGVALSRLYQWETEKWGVPVYQENGRTLPVNMIVIGMGKLGAIELNLSSDIDLIFSFSHLGMTVIKGQNQRQVSHQEFFTRLGQRLIHVLHETTEDGFVFRVDMRLRPYGQSGALALDFVAMEEYYQNQGRDWERYALIKARIVAGDQQAGEQLLANLKPFIYRRYLDYSVIDSLRDMKSLINRQVKQKAMDQDIKLGYGGIREIEFIAQAFQLIHGGKIPELAERSLLKVLELLKAMDLLPGQLVDELINAYIYLRRLEHRLQAYADQQTQTLPVDKLQRSILALAMGHENWSAFSEELKQQRTKVQQHFQNVIADPQREATGQQNEIHEWRAVWLAHGNEQNNKNFLAREGFSNPQRIQQCLETFRQSNHVVSMQSLGRGRLDKLMPLLLSELKPCGMTKGEELEVTLTRILALLEAITRRTAYMILLLENPSALPHLMRLCAASPWIAEQLVQYPQLLDEFLNKDTLYHPPSRQSLCDELDQQILRLPEDDLEQQMDSLRYFKHAHVLRVAASEISNSLVLMKVSDYLTHIAEVILEKVLQLAWGQMEKRYGIPVNQQGQLCNPDFVIVAYGKLAGIELGYSSDLDLVFIHKGSAHQDTIAGDQQKSINSTMFFTRLAQRIIHILNTPTRAGQLYEADMRLRPSGNSGLLVSPIDAFSQYQDKQAWNWEHQALVRARVVAGSKKLAVDFDAVRSKVLAKQRNPEKLREDVNEMREKMRNKLDKPEIFDLKQGCGGIVDIEFMVQYAVLAWSYQWPQLLSYPDNIRLLEIIEAIALIPSEDAQILREAYLVFRAEVHRLALQKQPGIVAVDEFQQYRQVVRRVWQQLMASSSNDSFPDKA